MQTQGHLCVNSYITGMQHLVQVCITDMQYLPQVSWGTQHLLQLCNVDYRCATCMTCMQRLQPVRNIYYRYAKSISDMQYLLHVCNINYRFATSITGIKKIITSMQHVLQVSWGMHIYYKYAIQSFSPYIFPVHLKIFSTFFFSPLLTNCGSFHWNLM